MDEGRVIRPYPYPGPPAALRPPHPRAAEAAGSVIDAIRQRVPGARVEHVGSSSVPGCAGKGCLDFVVAFADPAERERIDAALFGLGFGRQRNRDPFPEERPMRTGALAHDGETFLLHVHVVPAASGEAEEMIAFRDRLRADPDLVAAYVAEKRRIIASGVTEGDAYAEAKGAFVEQTLAAMQRHEAGDPKAAR